ncbi:MAG: DUF488 family protein [Bacteroides sp.]|nr:DUF488 family protein [Bacteroides sp.]
MTQIKIKRAYEPEDAGDGYRIYIDRLWPRGMSHETFHYDLWEKDVAPSTQLREWFHGTHDEALSQADQDTRWKEFESRYSAELQANPAYSKLRDIIASHPKVTLLYSSHDVTHNNAVVLADCLRHS